MFGRAVTHPRRCYPAGIVQSVVSTTPAFLFQDRFQPSLLFQVVAGVLVILQMGSVIAKMRRDGLSRFWRNSWSL